MSWLGFKFFAVDVSAGFFIDEGINSLDDSLESNNNKKGGRRRGAPHAQYTRGIDVQNVTLQGFMSLLS